MNDAAARDDEAALWRAWSDAATTERGDRALRELFADLDAAVRARGPTCWTSGKCCNFDAYGHRLYVTGFEIAWVVKQAKRSGFGVLKNQESRGDARIELPVFSSDAKLQTPNSNPLPAACVYQIDKLCSIHTIRPMGCRVFFCQEGTQEWQHELYEAFLSRLRALHDQLGLEYRYMEWRQGLKDATEALAE